MGTRDLNIILITDDDPVDSWVASQIAQQGWVNQVLMPTDRLSHAPKHLGKKLLTSPFRSFSAIPRELMLRRLEHQRQQVMTEHLWGGQTPGFSTGIVSILGIPIDQFNSPETAAQIRTLSPDLIITCGGPLLKPTIFEIPRLGCLNLQFGISDAYRGQHTLFWPMAMADWEHVGATIHRIDPGVNTGEVLAQVFPALAPEDTEFSIEIKTAHAILKAALELLSHLERHQPMGDHQPSDMLSGRALQRKGRSILYRDRTPIQEAQYRLKTRFGQSPIPTRAEQYVRYWHESADSGDNPLQTAQEISL